MASKSIDIIISSVFHNKGIDAARNAISTLKDKMSGIGGAFSKLAHSIGGTTGAIVGSLKTIVSGGILGAITVGIAGLVSLWNKHKEAVEENARVLSEKYAATIKRVTAEIKSGVDAEIKGINEVCKARDAEIARNEKLLQSIIDLKKANGELSKDEANQQSLDLKTQSAAFRAENEMRAGQDTKAVQEKYLKRMDEELEAMGNQLASYERQATDKIAAQRKIFLAQEAAKFAANNPGATPEEQRAYIASTGVQRRVNTLLYGGTLSAKGVSGKVISQNINGWVSDNNDSLYGTEIKALTESINQTYKARGELAKALEKTAQDIEAAKIKEETEKNIVAAQAVEQANKDYADAIRDATDSVKRNAESQKTASDKVNRAQTEFDKAFAMYRSEDKGAAQIAEERDYAADYKQLQKDAARYGGKWRIDELSSLIAAGDTKGQAAKLEEWRKSSSFTPEVESMVRAAAADQTKTTAEDELRKIANNTENLSQKLDELLQVK